VPIESADILHHARDTGQNQFKGGAVYAEAVPISTSQGIFVLVAQVHPLEVLENPALLRGIGFKLLLALICTGLLLLATCFGPLRRFNLAHPWNVEV
jgi:hypothetical protein